MGNKDLKFWKEKLLPEVCKINLDAGNYLRKLTCMYEEFGVNGTRDIRVPRFAPSNSLMQAFSWRSTPYESSLWFEIDIELNKRGVYGNKQSS